MKAVEEAGGGKIAVYSRKSRFTGKGESIENQIELCRQFIYGHYADKADSDILIYEDEGFSGGNTERPKLKEMMKDARSGKLSAIVCYRLDRISRNIGDFAKLIEELNNLQISFVSIKEQFDTSSPLGRAMMYIASVFSQLERETTAERIRDNMMELAKTGRWLGGTTPTGYCSEAVEKVTVDGKVRRAYKLKIVPEQAEVVRLIFDRFLKTNSLTKVETHLIQNHVKTKNGKRFTRFTIKSILENPVYMIADEEAYRFFAALEVDLFAEADRFDGKDGIMAYNKTIQKPNKANQTRAIREWIVSVGKHRGIIRGADWILTQQMLDQNKMKSYHKPKSSAALLSGLLVCKNCGSFMRPKSSQRKNAVGELAFSYLCELKEKSRCRNCSTKNINGNALDLAVCDQIKGLPAVNQAFTTEPESFRWVCSDGGEEGDSELERLYKVCQENEKEIAALVSFLSRSAATPAVDYITTQINRLHEETVGIKGRIHALEAKKQDRVLSDIQLETIRARLCSFPDIFEEMSVVQKRAALRSLIQRIVWDGADAHIYLFGAEEDEI